MARSAIEQAILDSAGGSVQSFSDVILAATSVSINSTSTVVLVSSSKDRLAKFTNTGTRDAFFAFDAAAVLDNGEAILQAGQITLVIPAGVALNAIVSSGSTDLAMQIYEKV